MKLKNSKIILLMLISLIFISCGKKKKEIIRPVELTKVVNIPNNLVYEYPGIVISENESPLSFMFGGKIVEMNVEIGSFVKKGDRIASVLKRDYEIHFTAAKAVADNAVKQFNRVRTLYKAKAIPKKSYDKAVADVEVAKQAANFAKSQLEETVIVAPYDGYITKKYLGLGAMADPGVPVVSISSVGEKNIKISVSEEDVDNMQNLDRAEFLYNDKVYKLKLLDVSKSKGILNLAYPVTFKIENNKSVKQENEKLLSDSSGIVKIYFKNTNHEKGNLIPVESILERDGKVSVWIYNKDNQNVNLKNIKIIKPYSDGKLIVDGLKVDEEIVTKGVHELIDNQKVHVVEPYSETNVGQML